MNRSIVFAGLGVLFAMIAGCAPRAPAPRSAIAAATPAGAGAGAMPAGATDCVETSRIREAIVRDNQTIDFVLNDGRTLRNTLPYTCSELGFERAFTYSTSINRLCSVDIITVIRQTGGAQRGASCGLGRFVPYTPPPKPAAG
jgi:hypothetical protein